MVAFIYLLEEVPHSETETVPWTKIGMSQNEPEWRLNANLKRGNPRYLKFGAVYEFESVAVARAAEKQAHLHFHHVKHQKEWFAVKWQEVAEWGETTQTWKKRVSKTDSLPDKEANYASTNGC